MFKQILLRFRDIIHPIHSVGANSFFFFLFFTSHGSLQDPSGTIRLRNREEHANEKSRNVSIDRRIALLINAFAQSPCTKPRATRYSILLGLKTVTSFLSMIIAKNEKIKKKGRIGIFYKIYRANYAMHGISGYCFHLDRLYDTINDT